MLRAETQFNLSGNTVYISNEAIINVLMDSGFKIDERVVNNPFFRYKLFSIFGNIQSTDIKDLELFDNKIGIVTDFGTYYLTVNSSNGLTAVYENNDCAHTYLFSKDKHIVEIIPEDEGFVICENNETAFGSIVEDSYQVTNSLSMRKVNKNGLVNKRLEVSTTKSENGLVFGHKSMVDPMLLDEYEKLFTRMSSEDEALLSKYERSDMINISHVQAGEKISANYSYIADIDVLGNLVDIDGSRKIGNISSDYDLIDSLSDYVMVDKNTYSLINGIATEMGEKIEIPVGTDNNSLLDEEFLKQMIEISKEIVLK